MLLKKTLKALKVRAMHALKVKKFYKKCGGVTFFFRESDENKLVVV